MLRAAMQWVGQVIVYVILCAGVGALASWPHYQQIEPNQAQIKLSLAHSGQRSKKCRRLTPQEIAKMPANERRPNTCARQRVAVRIQLLVDGNQLYDAVVEPAGLSRDGPARIYEKFVVSACNHSVTVRLKDTPGLGDFDYETTKQVAFAPYQSLAIDFSTDKGGFVFF